MKTIKIEKDRFDYKFGNSFIEIEPDELRRVIKENQEILQEEKKPFVKPFTERMIGKEYWMINSYGRKAKFIWNNSELENDLLSVNNIYWTESSCDKEIARRKALGNIMSYIRDNEIELVKDEDYLNNNIVKYGIGGWNYKNNEVRETDWYYYNDSLFNQNFYSQEDREKVIKNCKEDLTKLLKK